MRLMEETMNVPTYEKPPPKKKSKKNPSAATAKKTPSAVAEKAIGLLNRYVPGTAHPDNKKKDTVECRGHVKDTTNRGRN